MNPFRAFWKEENDGMKAMPAPMTATTSPLMMISKLFSSRVEGESWEEKVESHFKAELSRPEVLAGVI